jgi:hypothetical protein
MIHLMMSRDDYLQQEPQTPNVSLDDKRKRLAGDVNRTYISVHSNCDVADFAARSIVIEMYWMF